MQGNISSTAWRKYLTEEPRPLMLAIIREYRLEILASAGEMERIRRVHAYYYLRLSEDAETEIGGSQQAAWLDRLEREHDCSLL